MGETCYHSQVAEIDVTAWVDKRDTYIHRVTYGRAAGLSQSDEEYLLGRNGQI
jgi:hypothetical protein